MIFVFGSNLHGIHGAGSALEARCRGYPLGLGSGPHGTCYGVPTCSIPGQGLHLSVISLYVDQLVNYAWLLPLQDFQVTRIGCGRAGHSDEYISGLFAYPNLPRNLLFDDKWRKFISPLHPRARYWGTYEEAN
jgi:hypothetical protein